MRITILAGGRGAGSEEQAIAERYLARLAVPARIVETGRARKLPTRADVTVVLDETGVNLSSQALAARFAGWREAGRREILFIIGDADGHSAEVLGRAELCLAFGAATWPHLLVRAMLAEQIYRAFTILDGHPYHRG